MRKRKIYEDVLETRDENGNIKRSVTHSIRTYSKNEVYTKIFTDEILSNKYDIDTNIKILSAILSSATYCDSSNTNMIVELNGAWQRKYSEIIGVSDRNIRKYIRSFLDQYILLPTQEKSIYIINPFLFGKGEYKDIEKSKNNLLENDYS